MKEPTKTPATAHDALDELSGRIYRTQAIVATTIAATQASPLPDRLDLQYTLEAASEMLLAIASEVEFVGRRMQWVPKPEEAQS